MLTNVLHHRLTCNECEKVSHVSSLFQTRHTEHLLFLTKDYYSNCTNTVDRCVKLAHTEGEWSRHIAAYSVTWHVHEIKWSEGWFCFFFLPRQHSYSHFHRRPSLGRLQNDLKGVLKGRKVTWSCRKAHLNHSIPTSQSGCFQVRVVCIARLLNSRSRVQTVNTAFLRRSWFLRWLSLV